MTREEYLVGKKLNLEEFIKENEMLLNCGAIKNLHSLERTNRMIIEANKIIDTINNNEYWNESTEVYYNLIYKHIKLNDRKRDIVLF